MCQDIAYQAAYLMHGRVRTSVRVREQMLYGAHRERKEYSFSKVLVIVRGWIPI